MNVLFICGGNVGRSQMAEIIFESLAEGRHHARSAGTAVGEFDGQKLKDRASSADVLAVLKEIGFDSGDRVRTSLTPELVDAADSVVCMAELEITPDYVRTNAKTIYWDVADPCDTSLEVTRQARDQISSLVKALLATLSRD